MFSLMGGDDTSSTLGSGVSPTSAPNGQKFSSGIEKTLAKLQRPMAIPKTTDSPSGEIISKDNDGLTH